jgi:hypothetical protein
MYSLGHGGNDAQKTMGIIWMLLIAAGVTAATDPLPLWVVVSCYATISLGTLFGGWRIVRTMGMKITKLKPVGGFCAETGGAITLFVATSLGIPVSTTHTITSAIVGVGSARKMTAVRWGIAGSILDPFVIVIRKVRNRNDFNLIIGKYRFDHSLAFFKCKGISNVTSSETGTDDYDDFLCLLKCSFDNCFVPIVERLEPTDKDESVTHVAKTPFAM